MIFGVQCEGTNCLNSDPAQNAEAISAGASLVRIPVLVPFYNQTKGIMLLAALDVNVGDTQVFFVSIGTTQNGDLFYGPAWADGVIATVTNHGLTPEPKLTFDTPIVHYVNSAVARFSQIPLLQAAGISYWVMMFNLNGPSNEGSGPILTSPATWRNQIVVTMQQMLLTGAGPCGIGCENEEDGRDSVTNPGPPPIHNGDSSTLAQYFQKMGIVADVAQEFGVPSMDSGTTINGLQAATWFWLFYTIGTPYSRALADAFVTTTFSKNMGQFNFAGAIPTSDNPLGTLGDCLFMGTMSGDILTVIDVLEGSITKNAGLFGTGVALGTFEPPLSQIILAQISGSNGGPGQYQVSIPQDLPLTQFATNTITSGRLARMQKVDQILTALGTMGTTDYNGHFYEIIASSTALVMSYMNSHGFKPCIAGEIGIYSESYYDVIAKLQGCQWLQMPYLFWWSGVGGSAENGGNVSLFNSDGTLRNSGMAFKSFATTGQPQIMGQPGFPLAISPDQVPVL